MSLLPDDYARCHGHWNVPLNGHQCRDCLRRTAPMRDNVLYSYFAPPDFTTTCPERIAP